MLVTIEGLQLAFWEKIELPERVKNVASGEWEKTGKTQEKTRYYVRDEFGEKLEFVADNEYRSMEGSEVRVVLDIVYNEWQNKNEVKIKDIIQLA